MESFLIFTKGKRDLPILKFSGDSSGMKKMSNTNASPATKRKSASPRLILFRDEISQSFLVRMISWVILGGLQYFLAGWFGDR